MLWTMLGCSGSDAEVFLAGDDTESQRTRVSYPCHPGNPWSGPLGLFVKSLEEFLGFFEGTLVALPEGQFAAAFESLLGARPVA